MEIYTGQHLDRKKIIEVFNETEMNFVASVGREGSGYISSVFNSNQNQSFHEERPYCNGGVLKNILKGKETYLDKVILEAKMKKLLKL